MRAATAYSQSYLPDAYIETDRDPTTLLLFFHRIASKTDLLSSVIANMHNLPAALARVDSSELVGACELRGKLRHFAVLNKRFAGTMARCARDVGVDWGANMLQ